MYVTHLYCISLFIQVTQQSQPGKVMSRSYLFWHQGKTKLLTTKMCLNILVVYPVDIAKHLIILQLNDKVYVLPVFHVKH